MQNKLRTKVIAALLACTTVVPALVVSAPAMAAGYSMSLTGPGSTVPAGTTFNVTVNAVNVDPIRAFDFGMTFDPSKVQEVSVTQGTFLPAWASANGALTSDAGQMQVNNAGGNITDIGYYLTGAGGNGPSGSGALATITFQALANVNAVTAINVVNPLFTDTLYHNQSTSAAPVNVTIAAPAYTMAVSTPNSNVANGATFNVTVNAATLSQVRAFDVSLQFDPAKVQEVNVVTGTFLSDWATAYNVANNLTGVNRVLVKDAGQMNVDNVAGSITDIGFFLQGAGGYGPNGNGSLATITFQAAPGVDAATAITFGPTLFTDTLYANQAVSVSPLNLTIGVPPAAPAAPTASNGNVNATENIQTGAITLAATGNPAVTSYTITAFPTHGTLYVGTSSNTITATNATITGNTLSYKSNLGFTDPDFFAFKATNSVGDSNIATETINIAHVNHAPTAVSITAGTSKNTAVNVTMHGTDLDPTDTLTYAISGAVTGGTVGTVNGNMVLFTPTTGFSGVATFHYTVTDNGSMTSSPALVSVTVPWVNTPPVATDVASAATPVTVKTNVAQQITLTATDVDGNQTLTYSVVSNPAHGTVVVNGNSANYTPNTDYVGTDSFTFKANDGTGPTGDSNNATVYLKVSSGTVDVTGARDTYINFVAPVGSVAWNFNGAANTTYNTANTMWMSVNSSNAWTVQVNTLAGAGVDGHMTKWDGSNYDTTRSLSDPLHVVASSGRDPQYTQVWDVTTNGTSVLAAGTLQDFNGLGSYFLDYFVNFHQFVSFGDAALQPGYQYHTVVQFTAINSY